MAEYTYRVLYMYIHVLYVHARLTQLYSMGVYVLYKYYDRQHIPTSRCEIGDPVL